LTGSQAYTLAVNAASSLTVSPATLANATANTAYSATVSATGGSGSYTFAVSAGSLPSWLSLNSTTGALSGTPSTTGSYSFTIKAADTSNTSLTGSKAFTLTVGAASSLIVSPATLANATANSAYSATLSATGGSGSYTFSVSAGSLPSWLSLNSSTGVLSGTPTASGSATFTLKAKDTSNPNLTGTQAYTLTVVASSGQTFYVATTGNDNNSGSASAPFKTLQHAMMSLQPGDTLDVEAGDYAGFIVGWDSVAASSGDQYGYIDGTASAPITIQAAPGTAAGSVIINSQNNETQAGIDLEPGCNYITISGITINGSSGGLAEYPNKGEGIKVAGSNNVVVANCTITDIDYGFGIIADNANNVMLLDNTITGTGGQGNPDYGHGIYISGSTNDAVVKGNVIDNNSYIGIHVNGDASEGGIGLVTNALIADNFIYNNGQNGINCDGIQSSTIENNVIYGYQGFGICLYQSDAAGPSENNVIVNNTIVSTVSGAGAAIRILDGGTGNTILNNISLGGGGIALRISSDSMSGLVSNYNIGGGVYQSEDTGDTETLAQWLTSTGQDAHSSTATAAQLFVNASANNYQLSSTSPAINAGTSTDAPSTDILGNPRPSGGGFDIGAYQ
jgi:parallel beta-helix repeat protein